MGKRKLHEFINEVENKHCGICNKWKPLDKFAKHKRKWDKLQSNCKTCANKKQKQRDEKALKKREAAREAARGTGFLVCLNKWCTVKQLLQPVDQFISPFVRNDEPTDTCKTCRDKQNEAQKRRCAACLEVWIEYRKTHPCVICNQDPEHVHNPLLIEADHLGGKVTHCSNVSYWSHSQRGPRALRAELMTVQSLCRFHHRLQTLQRLHDNGRIQKQKSKLRRRVIMNKEKHKRGCCLRCERVLKKGEECAFDFDHRDDSTKFMYQGKTKNPTAFVDLPDAVFDTQWPLEKELVDLLCTNCHTLKDNRDGYRK